MATGSNILLGWKAGPEQYPPMELLDYAVAAEHAGFECLDVSDHFNPWDPAGQACFTWTWLGAVAVKTSDMVIGTGITCPILRYHPAIVAQAAATLGVMAPNRAYLCVGTGEALNEYAATGAWPGYDERQAMLAEAFNLIRALWTGEEITYEGTFYETRKAKLHTRPQQPVPLYVSTLVPDSAWFAGRHGDGLITVGGETDDVYRGIQHNFDEGARQAGKKPAGMPRLIELNVAYTSDEKAAVEMQKKYWAGTFIPALFDQKIYTPAMSAKNGKAVGTETIKQKGCFSADPEDHVKFALHYIELGFTQLFFHSAGPDQQGFVESYGRDVLPRIREEIQKQKRGLAAGKGQQAPSAHQGATHQGATHRGATQQGPKQHGAQGQRREPAGTRG